MPTTLRILLIVGALAAFAFIGNRIHKNKILMGDAIFWILLSFILIVLAVFPGIAFFFSGLLGFMSPSNFVFLLVVALVMAKIFANSSEISMLKHRVNELAQENALLEKRLRDEREGDDKK